MYFIPPLSVRSENSFIQNHKPDPILNFEALIYIIHRQLNEINGVKQLRAKQGPNRFSTTVFFKTSAFWRISNYETINCKKLIILRNLWLYLNQL